MDDAADCDRCKRIWERPKFDRKFFVLAGSLAIVWAVSTLVFHRGSVVVLAVVILTFLFGCWKTRRSVLAMTPSLFLPYVWICGVEIFSQRQWQSFADWLVMPGVWVLNPAHSSSDGSFQAITAAATVVQFLVFVTIGRISVRWLAGTSLVVAGISLLLSFFARGVFDL